MAISNASAWRYRARAAKYGHASASHDAATPAQASGIACAACGCDLGTGLGEPGIQRRRHDHVVIVGNPLDVVDPAVDGCGDSAMATTGGRRHEVSRCHGDETRRPRRLVGRQLSDPRVDIVGDDQRRCPRRGELDQTTAELTQVARVIAG